MEIKFIGTGGAFDLDLVNSSAIVEVNKKNFLIDCGHSVFPQIVKKNLLHKIDHVLVTHLHDDHCGSLSSLCIYFNFLTGRKMKIVFPSEDYKKELNNYLTHSLPHPEKKYVEWVNMNELPEISAINTFSKHVQEMQTWSFVFEDEKTKIVYSGDLGDGDLLFKKVKQEGKKVIFFHDVFFGEVKAHTSYRVLQNHLKDHVIYGYHCDHRKAPADNKIPLVGNQKEFLF